MISRSLCTLDSAEFATTGDKHRSPISTLQRMRRASDLVFMVQLLKEGGRAVLDAQDLRLDRGYQPAIPLSKAPMISRALESARHAVGPDPHDRTA
jgi:hypothetical protein